MKNLIVLLTVLLSLVSVKAQPITGGASGGFGVSFVTAEITNSTATDIVAGDVVAQFTEIPNAVRVAGGSATLFTVTYISANTNGTSVDLLLCSRPITIPANSSPFVYSAVDRPYIIYPISFVTGDFKPFATTNSIANKQFMLPVWASTNNIYACGICRQAITNVGNDVVTFTFLP